MLPSGGKCSENYVMKVPAVTIGEMSVYKAKQTCRDFTISQTEAILVSSKINFTIHRLHNYISIIVFVYH